MYQHKCAIDGCDVQIPRQELMCAAHWDKVPFYLQRIITSNSRRHRLGVEYCEAVGQAKAIVASLPKMSQRVTWRELMTRPRSA